MRLRASLPDKTPIYVYEGSSRMGQELLQAGATEVISDTIETILRFGTLVGACQSPEEVTRLRRLSFRRFGFMIDNMEDEQEQEVLIGSLSREYIVDLADQLGVSQRDIMEQWDFFKSIASDRDSVSIQELKELSLRSGSEGPGDGALLELCLDLEDDDGKGELTFVEYVRAYWKECKFDKL